MRILLLFNLLLFALVLSGQNQKKADPYVRVFVSELGDSLYALEYKVSDNWKKEENHRTKKEILDSLTYLQVDSILVSFDRPDSIISKTEIYLDRLLALQINSKGKKRMERIRSVQAKKQLAKLRSGKVKRQPTAANTIPDFGKIAALVCPEKKCPEGKTVRVSFDNGDAKCTCVKKKT